MKTTRSRDGTTIAYDVAGSGPPLIYITGASCFRRFLPVAQDAKAFADAFTVYNYDRRGRGDSGDTAPWSVEREVEDIEALIDAAGWRDALLVLAGMCGLTAVPHAIVLRRHPSDHG